MDDFNIFPKHMKTCFRVSFPVVISLLSFVYYNMIKIEDNMLLTVQSVEVIHVVNHHYVQYRYGKKYLQKLKDVPLYLVMVDSNSISFYTPLWKSLHLWFPGTFA
jgi:hypothetical protein